MLYEIWRETVRANGREIALRDLGTNVDWTFAQLFAEVEKLPRLETHIAFPVGADAEFVIEVLRAWRDGTVVCPLESGQAPPSTTLRLPDGIVHLKTTSATTGTPRLMTFEAAQLSADAENIVRTMGLRRDSPNLGVISLAHSYGFSNLVLPLLLHGIPLFLVGSALPEALRRRTAGLRDLTLAGVPALWRSWHEAGAIPAGVQLAISAGAPLPLGLETDIFSRSSLKVHNFYGSSECGGIAYDGTDRPRSDGACVGTPLQGVEVSVGDRGCLEVRSKAVARGYWPTQSPELGGGVFRTSDLGELLDGKVYLRGRASDQINVAGRKVSPETVERVLTEHAAVRDCLVFGVPAEGTERGEAIVACVALRSGADEVVVEEIKQHLLVRLPAWQVPRKWWVVPSLQENQRGKLSRSTVREEYLGLSK